jgi:hypothetical protein
VFFFGTLNWPLSALCQESWSGRALFRRDLGSDGACARSAKEQSVENRQDLSDQCHLFDPLDPFVSCPLVIAHLHLSLGRFLLLRYRKLCQSLLTDLFQEKAG